MCTANPPVSDVFLFCFVFCSVIAPICFSCIFGTVSGIVSVLNFCHHKSCLSLVFISKISTWTTGTPLSWSTMRNKMTSTQELYWKCYELLLVCRSFSNAFHLLAPIMQVESECNQCSSKRTFLCPANSLSTTIKWLCTLALSIQHVHGWCSSPKMGQFKKTPLGGSSSAFIPGLHHLAGVFDRDPPASH